jgi:hypothetical protein
MKTTYGTRLVGPIASALLYEGDSLADACEKRNEAKRRLEEGQSIEVIRIYYDDEGRELGFDVL